MKYLFCLFFLLSLSACGVETGSGTTAQGSSIDTTGGDSNTSTGGDSNASTGGDSNSSTGGDSNTSTGGDSNTSTGGDSGTIEDPVFDIVDAVYDADACKSAYATAIPLQDHNENNDRETSDDVNGLAVMSFYTETGKIENSNVIVFYKTLASGSVVGDTAFRKNMYGDNSQFRIEYDLVWVTEPNNTLYVETPKLDNELKSCFRVTLNSGVGSSILEQKVYR